MLELISLSATQGIFHQTIQLLPGIPLSVLQGRCLPKLSDLPSNSYSFVGAAMQERMAMAARLKMLYVAIVILLALLNLKAGAAYVSAGTGTRFAPLLG